MTQESTGLQPDYITDATGFSDEAKIASSARIYYLPRTNTETPNPFFSGAKYSSTSDEERHQSITRQGIKSYNQTFVAVQSANRELLDNAFERITDVIDSNLSPAERSNCFDEWKDILNLIARKVDHLSSNHRKILGSLITSTKKKDISDFDIKSLRLFLQTTNVLRQPRVTKPESRQAIYHLLNRNIDISLPLVPDMLDEKNIKELDDMMAKLLLEDRKIRG